MAKMNREENRLQLAALLVVALFTIFVMAHFARSFLIPFVMAVFIYLVISPILDFQIIRLRFPRTISILLTLIVFIIFMFIIFIFASQAFENIISTAGRYSESFMVMMRKFIDKLEQLGFDVQATKVIGQIQETLPSLITNTFGTLFGYFSSIVLVAIFVMFMVAGRNPWAVRDHTYFEIEQQVRQYLLTKTIVSALTGVSVWIVLSIFKLQLANVFGFLAFLLNFIPSLGSIISTLLPIPIAVVQYDSAWLIFLVILIPGLIQFAVGNGLEPKIMGRGLKLHPVTILLALSLWGLLWGVVGMFLSVPMTAVIRIVFMKIGPLKPVGEMLAGKLPGGHNDHASVSSETKIKP